MDPGPRPIPHPRPLYAGSSVYPRTAPPRSTRTRHRPPAWEERATRAERWRRWLLTALVVLALIVAAVVVFVMVQLLPSTPY
jgi:hypothetical protein